MKPVILFDGVCNLCNHVVDFVLRHEAGPEFRFAASQSPAGRRLMEQAGISADDVSRSIYVLEDGRVDSKSTAVLRIARRLRFPWRLAYGFVVVPRPPRDWCYGLISRNRYRWFGTREVCRLPAKEERDRFLEDESPSPAL